MNIKQAKEQIKNAVKAYLTKDEYGNPVIPTKNQRPIFLLGCPGIGKTDIMSQIAGELGIGLVSYSMTHHTRQSALGLPFITKKIYGGVEYSVSEYTMSEIIASVYDMIEETGIKEGILFLDEINCVSETLTPVMLQFLQYKVFGKHKVPDGWIIATAGNPPEYNNSVKEFDIVTWDRLKRINVEPNYKVWKEYAYKAGIHGAILTYLDIMEDDFYHIETTVDGKEFVTARGWTDLSNMIYLYEKNDIPVTEELIIQYLQCRRIAKSFAVYYDLYNKYRSDYQIDKILNGDNTDEITARAKGAKFDERLSVLGLLLEAVTSRTYAAYRTEKALNDLFDILKSLKMHTSVNYETALENEIQKQRDDLAVGKQASSISAEGQSIMHELIAILEECKTTAQKSSASDNGTVFKLLVSDYDKRTKKLKKEAAAIGKQLSNVFAFCENAFGDGQEMLILVTELTINYYCAWFINQYGCKEYFTHNKDLLLYERRNEIDKQLDGLSLEN